MILGLSLLARGAMAGPALPPPVGQKVYAVPPAPAPAPAAPDPPPDGDPDSDNVEIVDAALKGKLGLSSVGTEPSANNLLTVFIGLKNKTPHNLSLDVQTIYKNAVGDPLNAGSWITLTLKPHEEREYRSTSISEPYDPNAVEAHFLIRIRRAASIPASAHD